jgi:hypothetical protein
MAISTSSSALPTQREPAGLGAIRVGNQPTPPSARYSSGVGRFRPTPYFNPFSFVDSMHYAFLSHATCDFFQRTPLVEALLSARTSSIE